MKQLSEIDLVHLRSFADTLIDENLTQMQLALRVIWLAAQHGIESCSTSELATALHMSGLTPKVNVSRLRDQLSGARETQKTSSDRFRLEPKTKNSSTKVMPIGVDLMKYRLRLRY